MLLAKRWKTGCIFFFLLGALAVPLSRSSARAASADPPPLAVKNEPLAPESVLPGQLTPYFDRFRLPEGYSLRYPRERMPWRGDVPLFDRLFVTPILVSDTLYKSRKNLDFRPRLGGDFTETNQFSRQILFYGAEIKDGDDVFDPARWRLRAVGAWQYDRDLNALEGNTSDTDAALQEAFGDLRLFEIGKNLDLTFLRAGLQVFQSDFHGLVLFDNIAGGRVFGEIDRNRWRYDLVAASRVFKDARTGLVEFNDNREQMAYLARLTRDDLIPGWNAELSFAYNSDKFNRNLDVGYASLTFNGNLGRLGFNPAVHLAAGKDDRNPFAGRSVDILAALFVLDMAYTFDAADWLTWRLSYAHATGDSDPTDSRASGFDSINDTTVNLFGGPASYFVGENIKLGNTDLVRGNSFLPSLRGGNATSNFVNPGIHAVGTGFEAQLSHRVFAFVNTNYYRFANTQVLEQLVGRRVDKSIGVEGNTGFFFRPFLDEVVIVGVALSYLKPDSGLRDLFGTDESVYSVSVNLKLAF